jgi:hypothetical protein
MKSKVYFIAVQDANDLQAVNVKLKKLLEESRVLDFILAKKAIPALSGRSICV